MTRSWLPFTKGGKQQRAKKFTEFLLELLELNPPFSTTLAASYLQKVMKNMERLWNEPLAHISSVLLRHRCTSTSSCHTYSKVLKKDHHLHMCVQHLYLANRAWQCPINTYERCEGPTKWSFTNCLRSQQDTNVFAQQFLVLFWHQHKWYRNQKASKDVLSPIERVW